MNRGEENCHTHEDRKEGEKWRLKIGRRQDEKKRKQRKRKRSRRDVNAEKKCWRKEDD